jgi:hypothetical protein
VERYGGDGEVGVERCGGDGEIGMWKCGKGVGVER